ncbi:MAG: oligosaccharide flippase family protein, partial [Actinomycetota bacterium]
MSSRFAQVIVRNTLATLGVRLAIATVSIWLTPYVLAKLGNELYGLWVLALSVTGYVGLVDLGYGTSLTKYVAEYNTRGDREGVNGVFTTGLVVYLVVTVGIVAAAHPVVRGLIGLLAVPEGLTSTAYVVLQLGVLSLVVWNFAAVYQSVVNGLQRMDVSTAIHGFQFLGYAVGTVLALQLGFGIRGLAATNLVVQLVGLLLSAHFAYRLDPGLRLHPRAVRQHFTTLFRYGLNVHISAIAGLVNFHFDKLLINRVVGVSHVALYDIGSRLPLTLRSFPTLLLSALTPASAELEVRRGRAELYALFSRASRYVSLVAFPLFVGAMAMGQPFVDAWVGPGYDTSVVTLRILCVGYLLNTIAGPV